MAGGGAGGAGRTGPGAVRPGGSPAPGRRRTEEVQRITTAPVGQRQHQQQQIGRYLISMGIRTACFVLFVVTYVTVGAAWSWGFLALAVVLPYIAVLAANAGRETVGPTSTSVTPVAPTALGASAPGEPLVGDVYRPEDEERAGDRGTTGRAAPEDAGPAGAGAGTSGGATGATWSADESTGDRARRGSHAAWRGAA